MDNINFSYNEVIKNIINSNERKFIFFHESISDNEIKFIYTNKNGLKSQFIYGLSSSDSYYLETFKNEMNDEWNNFKNMNNDYLFTFITFNKKEGELIKSSSFSLTLLYFGLIENDILRIKRLNKLKKIKIYNYN